MNEDFGHEGLEMSDFGWWKCSTCGMEGREDIHPEDFPCVPLDSSTAEDVDSSYEEDTENP